MTGRCQTPRRTVVKGIHDRVTLQHTPNASLSAPIEPGLSAKELNEWLIWAGRTLLAMTIASPLPKEPRTAWPAYATDVHMAYGYTNERLRASIPTSKDIALMDEIIDLVALIDDRTVRRIVNARMLVTPIAQRHLYSWTKIAFMLHTNTYRIIRWHTIGLRQIIRQLPQSKVDAIRQSLASRTT